METPASSPASTNDTPLLKQYYELKAQAGDALLFFRMGDFYELFGADAIEASRLLEITLTSRDRNKPNPLPMAGVPWHSAQGYIQKLLALGKKVAIGEQVEDPALVKGKAIVRREIVRVFTPGVQFDSDGVEPQYLAAITRADKTDSEWTLACLDAHTGEILVSESLSREALLEELSRKTIRHLLSFEQHAPAPFIAREGLLTETLSPHWISATQAETLLKAHYGIASLEAFFPTPGAILAAATALQYVLRTQFQERLAHLRLPSPLRAPDGMRLGPATPEHLDLADLFTRINRTRSALGARELRRWLLGPLKLAPQIRARQAGVRDLLEGKYREKIQESLGRAYDLERISGRVTTRLAHPRDTLALGQTLAILPEIARAATPAQAPELVALRAETEKLATRLAPLSERILKSQREDAPFTARDGGIFAVGTDPELDRLITLHEHGEKFLIDLEARERAATGIPSLKVRYNRVFGYYIEVTTAHLKNVPAHYQRKQTTVGSERFFTEELKKFEEEILTAESRRKALESELFQKLLAAILEEVPSIMTAARIVAQWDALCSLAALGDEVDWNFPVIDETRDLTIKRGRHPLVDQSLPGGGGGAFVPNDLELSPDSRLTLIITGPNMGGKSTIMRQVALIVILGQMGAPVPAREAQWGAFSSVYTRIGAHDAIARGQSTFMVEMNELAHLLHHADNRSLIVLDEVGRGTSTFDGMSVAWSTLEWITERIQARTLFATHYHELTTLEHSLPRTANAHLAVDTSDEKLRFLYELRAGASNESYGIHVAQLAGIPTPVIERAWDILKTLEKPEAPAHDAAVLPAPEVTESPQLSLFGQAQIPAALRQIESELRAAEINAMTPLQALQFVVRLQDMSRESAQASS